MAASNIPNWIATLRAYYARSNQTVDDVVFACRSLATIIPSDQLRDHPDFGKILTFALGSFIKLTNDDKLQVWSVADECLLSIVKPLIRKHPTRILSEFMKGIKSGVGRAQRTSIEKFAALCHYINPQKCRNFVALLLESFTEILKNGNSSVLDTLGESMDLICDTLIYFVRDEEAKSLIEQCSKHLESSDASTRRAMATGITAVCFYYPKCMFSFTFDLLMEKYNGMKEEIETGDKKRNAHLLQGLIRTLYQLMHASARLSSNEKDPRDPMASHIDPVHLILLSSMKHEDHNVVSRSLELANTIFSHYRGWRGSKNESNIIQSIVKQLCHLLLPSRLFAGSEGPHSRVSVFAMSLHILGEVIVHYTHEVTKQFSENSVETNTEIMKHLFAGFSSDDPLLKGKTIFLASCILFVSLKEKGNNDRATMMQRWEQTDAEMSNLPPSSSTSLFTLPIINMDTIIQEIVLGIQDSSSVSSAESCSALELLLPLLGTTIHATIILSIISTLTNFMHPYWLIKCKIVSLLATAVDYILLNYLEKQELRTQLTTRNISIYTRDALQSRVITFIAKHLEDEDLRVVDAAALALRALTPQLHCETYHHVHSPYSMLYHSHILLGSKEEARAQQANRLKQNMTLLLSLLLNGLQLGHSDRFLKGYYHGLAVVFEGVCEEDAGKGKWLYDLTKQYTGDILPLTLTRLTSTGIALDLDFHTEVIKLFTFMFLPFPTLLSPHSPLPQSFIPTSLRYLWKAVLTHLLRLFHILMDVVEASSQMEVHSIKPQPHLLGAFANLPLYVDLFNVIYKQKQEFVVTSLAPTKIQLLAKHSLRALSGVIRCAGRDIVPYYTEIVNSLSFFGSQFALEVAQSVTELFLCSLASKIPKKSPNALPHSLSDISVVAKSPQQRTRKRVERSVNVRNFRKVSISASVTATSSPSTLSRLLHKTRIPTLGVTQKSGVARSISFSVPDVRADPTPERKRDMLRHAFGQGKPHERADHLSLRIKLEPILELLLTRYMLSHDILLHQTILTMLSILSKFGFNIGELSSGRKFVPFLVNQILGKRSYLRDPPSILPYMYYYISHLVTSPGMGQLIPSSSVLKLTSCVFTSSQWGSSGILLYAIIPMLHTIFSSTLPTGEEAAKSFCQLQDYFVSSIVTKLPLLPACAALLYIFPILSPALYTQYSSQSGSVLLSALTQCSQPLIQKLDDIETYDNLLNHCAISVDQYAFSVATLLSLSTVAPSIWLPNMVTLLRGVIKHIDGMGAAVKQIFQTKNENSSWLHFLLRILSRALSQPGYEHYEENSKEEKFHWIVQVKLYQQIIFLIETFDEMRSTGDLLSFGVPQMIDVSDMDTEELKQIGQLSLVKNDRKTLFLLYFILLERIGCSSESLWEPILPHSLSILYAGTDRAPWDVFIAKKISLLSFCSISFRTNLELNIPIYTTALNTSSFLELLIQGCRDPDVQSMIQIFPTSACHAILGQLEDSSGCQEKKKLLPMEYIIMMSLLPRSSPLLLPRFLSVACTFIAFYIIAPSSRKLMRRLIKEIMEEISPSAVALSRDALSSLKDSLTFLRHSFLYRLGSDQEQTVLRSISFLSTKIESKTPPGIPKDSNEFKIGSKEEYKPSKEPEQSSTMEFDSFSAYCISQFRKGKYGSLLAMPHTNLEVFKEFLRAPENPFPLEQVTSFLLQKESNLFFEEEGGEQREGTGMRKDLANYFLYKLERIETFGDAAMFCHCISSISRVQPIFVEGLAEQITSEKIVKLCSNAVALYMAEKHYKKHNSSKTSISKVLQTTSFLLTIKARQNFDSTVLRDHSFIGHLIDLYRLSLDLSEPLFDILAKKQLQTIDWEISSISDLLTELLTQLLTPSLQQHCSFITPMDTRPSTLFLFCHGSEALHSFVDLLACLLRLLAIPVYPELIEEDNDLFLESPIRAIGMTASDAELLQHSLQLLPSVFVSSVQELDSIVLLYQRILQSNIASEPLQVTAAKGFCVILNVMDYLLHCCTSSGPVTPGEGSKSDFFLETPNGRKLTSLQKVIEQNCFKDKFPHPHCQGKSANIINASTIRFQRSGFASLNVDDVPLEEQFASSISRTMHFPVALEFLYQIRYPWITRSLINEMSEKVSRVLLDAEKQKDSQKLFLRQYALSSLLGIAHLLETSRIKELMIASAQRFEEEAAGDGYGIQLSVITFCRCICLLHKRSIILPPVLLASVGHKIKYCLERQDAASSIAGLKAFLFLARANLQEIVLPLLPYMFTYCSRSLEETEKISELLFYLLAVVFRLIETFTNESEQQNFTTSILPKIIAMGEDPNAFPVVVSSIFRGLNAILISFSLSHTQRTLVRSFALQHLPSSLFMYSLQLMLSSMYTGDQNETHLANASGNPDTLVQMDNIERAKVLFAKLHKGKLRESCVVARVIPRLLVDFFLQDQVMSLILGEFVRTGQHQRPELVAQVLFDVIQIYEQERLLEAVMRWICLCLKNFIQIEPFSFGIWSMTCLFISVSSSPAIRGLYHELALDSTLVDESMFLYSAVDFYNHPELSMSDREEFFAIFEGKSEFLFLRLSKLLSQ